MTERPVILVVDDEPLVRRTVERALQRADYEVHVASAGTEALHMLDGGLHPALVVSDVMMDDMEGPQFVAQLRTRLPGAHVLFMSGETPENLPHVGLDKDHTDFLEKPFAPQAFVDKVAQILGRDHGG